MCLYFHPEVSVNAEAYPCLVRVLFIDELAHHYDARLLQTLADRHPRRHLRTIALVGYLSIAASKRENI